MKNTKKIRFCLIMMICWLAWLGPAQAVWSVPVGGLGADPKKESQGQKNLDFTLGPEDIIEISVWGNKEFAGALPVRPDGFISIPLIGDVKVAGLTPAQLKKLVTEKLRKFITDASVTIFVKEINSINISIAGEVNLPGTYKVNRPITL